MSTQRAFDQVKNILGKLDRNIDAARARRLQGPATPPATTVAAAPQPNAVPVPPAPTAPAVFPMPQPPQPARLAPGAPNFSSITPQRSAYGRAQPMRPEQRSPQTGT